MRTLLITTIVAVILFSSVALTQQTEHSTASVPDFSGTWTRPYMGIEPPLSGPGPVTNRMRRNGKASYFQLVGDYTNPILKPQAAGALKKFGEIELNGVNFPTPRNQCWPQAVPLIFFEESIQLLQRPDKITIVYNYDHEVRHVFMNKPHPVQVTPSWSGDSIGHYEGDTLVIDTVGIKVGPFAMADWLGTPRTEALHVLERYRLIDYAATLEGQERGLKEYPLTPGADSAVLVDSDYKGKGLQLEFTVEDEGVFTMPWSGIITYRRGVPAWLEHVCAENLRATYVTKDSAVPQAEKPDF
jgi:hypothetical protein